MSKTDNTRPFRLQADDPNLPGYVWHSCGRGQDCDYIAGNGITALRAQHIGDMFAGDFPNCLRQVHYWGGSSGPSKQRQFNKRLDARERRYAGRRALRRMIDPDDFDVPCVRGDKAGASWFD